jgi:hypothetical protein
MMAIGDGGAVPLQDSRVRLLNIGQSLRDVAKRQAGCATPALVRCLTRAVQPALAAAGRNTLQRTHLHLAADEHTGRSDALPDIVR